MTEKEMLLTIIELQDQVIRLMKQVSEKNSASQTHPIPMPFLTPAQDMCSDGNYHQYPNPWFSTSPPACLKCNKVSSFPTVTCTTSSTSSAHYEDEHGVYCGV